MNTERYLAILDRIKKDPSCHKQDWWHCGTAHCFAGHAQIDSGLPINDTTCATDASHWLAISPASPVRLVAPNRPLADLQPLDPGSAGDDATDDLVTGNDRSP